MRLSAKVCGVALCATVLATVAPGRAGAAVSTPTPPPRYDHVVVVVEENTAYDEMVDNPSTPYLATLQAGGVSFSDYSAITHPSQPNYLAMFSGSPQGVPGDDCPAPGSPFTADNLAAQLTDAGLTFGSYNEDWNGDPAVCTTGNYVRWHAPWFDFSNVPPGTARPMTAFPTDYTTLPTVSYVVPNLCNDMHNRGDGTGCDFGTADAWLRNNLGAYATWAQSHNSLLVVTWDEDDQSGDNVVPTVLFGAHVNPGIDPTPYNHYSLLRTIEDMYGLRTVGGSSTSAPVTGVWAP